MFDDVTAWFLRDFESWGISIHKCVAVRPSRMIYAFTVACSQHLEKVGSTNTLM